jgi:hypothetical protein
MKELNQYTVIGLLNLGNNDLMVAGVVEGGVYTVDNTEYYPDRNFQRVAYNILAADPDAAIEKAFKVGYGEATEDADTCSMCGEDLEDTDADDGLCSECTARNEAADAEEAKEYNQEQNAADRQQAYEDQCAAEDDGLYIDDLGGWDGSCGGGCDIC